MMAVKYSAESDFPFSRFSEEVRSLDTSSLDELQAALLSFCFPQFELNRKPRRFAGDIYHLLGYSKYDLPRNRYYTISRSMGFPVGASMHLRNELCAYQELDKTGPIEIVSSPSSDLVRIFNLQNVNDLLFVLLPEQSIMKFEQFLANTDQISVQRKGQIASLLSSSIRELNFTSGQMIISLFSLPVRTEGLEICRCIDLRLPTTRAWFFNQYRRGVDGWPGYGVDVEDEISHVNGFEGESDEVGRFALMLPALTDQQIGGPTILQVIAANLRTNGVEALVFPSARCNFGVEIRAGQIYKQYGWNLVDYRDAPVPSSPGSGPPFLFNEEPGSTSILKNIVDDDSKKFLMYHMDNVWFPPNSPYFKVHQEAGSLFVGGIEEVARAKLQKERAKLSLGDGWLSL